MAAIAGRDLPPTPYIVWGATEDGTVAHLKGYATRLGAVRAYHRIQRDHPEERFRNYGWTEVTDYERETFIVL